MYLIQPGARVAMTKRGGCATVELVRCLLTTIIQRYLGGPEVHLENVRLKKVGSV